MVLGLVSYCLCNVKCWPWARSIWSWVWSQSHLSSRTLVFVISGSLVHNRVVFSCDCQVAPPFFSAGFSTPMAPWLLVCSWEALWLCVFIISVFSSLVAVFFLNGRQSRLMLLTPWPASHFYPTCLKSLVVGRMSSGTDVWAMDHWKAKWNIKLLLCQELWICKWTPALLITEPREGKKEEESLETQNGLLKVKSPSFLLY